MPATKKSSRKNREKGRANRDLPEPVTDEIARRQGKYFALDGRKVQDLSHVGCSAPDTDPDV